MNMLRIAVAAGLAAVLALPARAAAQRRYDFAADAVGKAPHIYCEQHRTDSVERHQHADHERVRAQLQCVERQHHAAARECGVIQHAHQGD